MGGQQQVWGRRWGRQGELAQDRRRAQPPGNWAVTYPVLLIACVSESPVPAPLPLRRGRPSFPPASWCAQPRACHALGQAEA